MAIRFRSNAVLIHLIVNPFQMWTYSHESAGIFLTTFLIDYERSNTSQNVSIIFNDCQWSSRVTAARISVRTMNTNCAQRGRSDDSIAIDALAFFICDHLYECPPKSTWNDNAALDVSAETGHLTQCQIVRDIIARLWQCNCFDEF